MAREYVVMDGREVIQRNVPSLRQAEKYAKNYLRNQPVWHEAKIFQEVKTVEHPRGYIWWSHKSKLHTSF